MPGKGLKPCGRPIPPLNGANEAPTEFTLGVGSVIVPNAGCSEEENLPPGGGLAGISAYHPGSSNCLNRSRSASCSGVGAAGCGGGPNDGTCPTGAINDERLLLHAELCTTLFSEQPGDLNHALSADCLFGCLDCQQICPANSGLLRIESAGVTFDRRETEAILSGDGAGACDTTESVTCKLALLGLTEEAHIGRNLAHLIVARRLSRQGPRNYSPDAHICEPPG